MIRTWESTNDLDRRNYAIFNGFKSAICENIRDALDLQYYEQIKEVTYMQNNPQNKNFVTATSMPSDSEEELKRKER